MIKITINDVAQAGSVEAAIEAWTMDSDTVSSGIIGSEFTTSGPGSGWQRNYTVDDYARRALSSDYGATSYVDCSDGREATLEESGDLVWSDSVIRLECPDPKEALEEPEALKQMGSYLWDNTHPETDYEAWNNLAKQIKEAYWAVQSMLD